MSELSEKDRAALRRIEQRIAVEDPRLMKLLTRFGRRRLLRLPARRRLLADLVGLCCLLTILLVIIFTR